ncbi:MAG: VWA domain-containing protein [Verrucomicrobiota bacterium]
MSFANIWVLALLPLVWWLLSRQRERTSVTVPSIKLWETGETGRARWLWLPITLRRACVVLILLAVARPQAGTTYDAEVTEGIAIQMLIDVSSSMDMGVTDLNGKSTSRMEVAKDMVERFIAGDGEALEGRPNDLIGLITFARYADTRSPLTFGHEALLQIVRNLEIQERPNEDGTAYGDALAIAAARLQNLEELKHGSRSFDMDSIRSKLIILLTDGENNSGSHLPLEAAGLAKAWGCRVYVVSLGDSGTDGIIGDENAPPLSSAERVLEHIAKETGGHFRQAHDFESLVSFYSEIDLLERSEISSRSFDRVAEWFWLPLACGLAALCFALILESTWLRVVP